LGMVIFPYFSSLLILCPYFLETLNRHKNF
jgi:hypothetical protein